MLNQVVLVGRIMDIKDNVLKMNIPERDAEDIRVNVELTGDMVNNMKEYVAVVSSGLSYSEASRLRALGEYVNYDENTNYMAGYPVAVIVPAGLSGSEVNNESRWYLMPWYDRDTSYRDSMYFQEYGGWGKRASKSINLPSLTTATTIAPGNTVDIYGETLPYMRYAASIEEMLSMENTGLKVNTVCYDTDITDMLNISGFVVRINSYLFQLEWNDSIANTFYNNYYTINEPEKISAFLADTTTFQMKYIGKYEQYTDKGTMYSQKSQSEQMLVTCTRTLDKNIVNLQKKYPVFQVKTPICAIAYNDKDKFIGYRAYIGTKEGITPKSKFVVLEKQVSEDGQTFYKQVGTLKPDKNEIWDNRYMVSEEELKNNGGRPLTATLLKGTKNLMPGMLLFEGKFDAKQEKAKIAQAKKEAKAAKKKEKEQKK